MFDLNLLPIHYRNSQEQNDLPGLMATAAPRRSARGRTGDQLVLLVSLSRTTAFAPGEFKYLLGQLTQTYFQTAGSVTAAMRAVVDSLNNTLMERNLRNKNGGQNTALLNLAAVHAGRLYLAHGGPTHSFLIQTAGVEHDFDPLPGLKGLGTSRTPYLRYFQGELEPGDLVVLSPEPLPTWTPEILSGSTVLTLDQAARRLVNQQQPELSAALIQFQAGSGKINLIRPQRSATAAKPVPASTGEAAQPPEQPTSPSLAAPPAEILAGEETGAQPPVFPEPAPAAAPEPPAEETRAPIEELTSFQPVPPDQPVNPNPSPVLRGNGQGPKPQKPAASLVEDEFQPLRASVPTPTETPDASRARSHRHSRPAPASPDSSSRSPAGTEKNRQQPKSGNSLRPVMARIWQGGRRLRRRSAQATRSFLGLLLPGPSDQPGSLSRGTMAFIAIAVPLIVVTIASVVYFQRGRAIQFEEYFLQARQAAQGTQNQSDPQALRSAWQQTLVWLEKAETYQTTADSKALREQAQTALDGLEGITRLAYQPAILGGLASTVQLTRMIASSNDLYMLDSSKGRVIRATLTGRGYEVDPEFRCEPGPSGSTVIGPLVDIVPLPKGNEFKAAIMALDSNANLLYCIPGEAPLSAPLAPPEKNWGKIQAFTYDLSNLYVLDPQVNTVWVYAGGNGTFGDTPQSFFDEDAPAMADVIDLAVNNTDLYLLHADGHLTLCTLSYISSAPTRCADPAPYTDSRPDRAGTVPVLPDTHFEQILFTPPPDPSIYMLDPASSSIYHFSLRLNIQRQMRAISRPESPLPSQPATAYAIGTNRTAFIAYGNQVYYALVP